MKKLFALVLALVFALSFAVSALAFTEVEYDDDDNPVTLAIKLIDVGDGIVNVNFTAPPSNRGYVKNEVVCAIVSMYVPKGAEIKYDELVFYGENVTLWQDENFYGDQGDYGMLRHMSKNVSDIYNALSFTVDGTNVDGPFQYAENMPLDNSISLYKDFGLGLLEDPAKDTTYHFAIFGKVTGDNAWMKAKLVGKKTLKNAWVGYTLGEPDGVAASYRGMLLHDDTDEKLSADNGKNHLQFSTVKDDYLVGYFNPKEKQGAPDGVGTLADFRAEKLNTNADTAADLYAVDPDEYLGVGYFEAIGLDLDGDKILYFVVFDAPDAFGAPGAQAAFVIVTDKKYNCVGMYVFAGTWFQIKVVGSNYKDAQYIAPWGVYVQFEALTGGPQIVFPDAAGGLPSLMARYIVEEVIWDVFGLNLNVKGQMKPEFWSTDDVVEAEVQVSPWYNEVTVPAEIELEAPKTGDTVSAIGFVLIAIAGLAFAAVRKVRA